MDPERLLAREVPDEAVMSEPKRAMTLSERVDGLTDIAASHTDAFARLGERMAAAETQIVELLREVGR